LVSWKYEPWHDPKRLDVNASPKKTTTKIKQTFNFN
jgi:hypothetical protein